MKLRKQWPSHGRLHDTYLLNLRYEFDLKVEWSGVEWHVHNHECDMVMLLLLLYYESALETRNCKHLVSFSSKASDWPRPEWTADSNRDQRKAIEGSTILPISIGHVRLTAVFAVYKWNSLTSQSPISCPITQYSHPTRQHSDRHKYGIRQLSLVVRLPPLRFFSHLHRHCHCQESFHPLTLRYNTLLHRFFLFLAGGGYLMLIHVTVDEELVTVAVESAAVGRRLKALSTDDYNDPSANRGHDPRNRIGGGGWKVREPWIHIQLNDLHLYVLTTT